MAGRAGAGRQWHERWQAVIKPGRRTAILLLLVAGLAVGVALVLAVWPVLVPFGLALVVAYVVAPAVGALECRGLSRAVAILVVYLVLSLLAATAVLGILPGAYSELERLAASVPEYAAQVRGGMASLQRRFQDPGLPTGLREGVEGAISRVERQANRLVAAVVGNLLDYVEWAVYLLLAPVLAYYLLRDQERIKRGFARLLPRRWRRPVLDWLAGVDGVIGGFVRGQLVLAVVVGSLAMLASGLLGLRFAVLLGLWAGLAELIPYAGPVIGAVPAVLSGLLISPLRALQVALAFALIQQLENAVLGPRVLGEKVGLHPLVVFFVILAGGYLAGVPGMLLAVPVAGILRVTGQALYRALALPPSAVRR